MSTRVEHIREGLKSEAESREKLEGKFVTIEYFKAVVEPLQRELRDVGKDIKRILALVSRHNHQETDS